MNRLRRANKAEVAEFFEVSVKTVDGWVRRGCPIIQRGMLNKPWVFDLMAVALWKAGPQAGEDGAMDPEKLPPTDRRAWFDSEAKRRELQIRDRELIPAVEVQQAVSTAFAAIASELRSIPDHLERRGDATPEQAERISQAIDAAMEALADRLATLSTETRP